MGSADPRRVRVGLRGLLSELEYTSLSRAEDVVDDALDLDAFWLLDLLRSTVASCWTAGGSLSIEPFIQGLVHDKSISRG